MRITIDSDDAGVELKRIISDHLQSLEVEASDLDMLGSGKVDYPDIGYNLALRVAGEEFDCGVLICGAGLGMAMIANKSVGVYTGGCHDVYPAQRLRKSNDAQIITLGARVVGPELAKVIVSAWLQSEFDGGRSAPKVARMRELERLDREREVRA
jgi:ribose 5-phosphate isomerase B